MSMLILLSIVLKNRDAQEVVKSNLLLLSGHAAAAAKQRLNSISYINRLNSISYINLHRKR